MHSRQDSIAPPGIGHSVKFIGGLAVKPKRLAVAKIRCKADGGIGGNATLSSNDVLDTALRHPRVEGESRLADAQGLEEFFIEDFARMDGRHTVIHGKLLVVVNDFHGIGVAVTPDKANSPLVIDTDAVLPYAVALEGFKPVPRRDSQILERDRVVKDFELSHGHSLQLGRKTLVPEAIEKPFGHAVFKAANHTKTII